MTIPEIIPGTAAPQCGNPGIGTIPVTETVPEIIGFPGTAAPQCGINSDQTEANRSGEQPVRGLHSRGYLPASTQNTLPGAIQLETACGSMFLNSLRQHVPCHNHHWNR
ncbi:MAG: hypothetical protein NTV33_01760 [Coprothermobacterota bacterium]|nr:hypothetical protein [Coprothermobacterota bacterium]